jgi:mannose-6-phosphate isomerase-like protein (cupin superfamily)
VSEEALPRLVVTGHSNGRSVIVSDQRVPAIDLTGSSVQARFLWGRDDVARFPDAGAMPPLTNTLPPPGGCRFSTLTIDAGASSEYHNFIVAAMGSMAEPSNPGFHTTPSLDFILVLEGEFTLEVDDENERVLRKGDFAVLNGVRHRWHNRGATSATLAAVMIGAA